MPNIIDNRNEYKVIWKKSKKDLNINMRILTINGEPILQIYEKRRISKNPKDIHIMDCGRIFISFGHKDNNISKSAKLILKSEIFEFTSNSDTELQHCINKINSELDQYNQKLEKEKKHSDDPRINCEESEVPINSSYSESIPDIDLINIYNHDINVPVFDPTKEAIVHSEENLQFHQNLQRHQVSDRCFLILNIQQEMAHYGGVLLKINIADLEKIYVTEYKDSKSKETNIYISKIDQSGESDLPLYVGDSIVQINGTQVNDLITFNELIKNPEVDQIKIRRIPNGKAFIDMGVDYIKKKEQLQMKIDKKTFIITQINRFNALNKENLPQITTILKTDSSIAVVCHDKDFIQTLLKQRSRRAWVI